MNEKIITLDGLGVFKALIEQQGSDRSAGTEFTVSVSAWAQMSVPVSGLNYSAEITDARVTSSSNADVLFDIDCREVVVQGAVSPMGKTQDGKIVLYAENLPAGNISGVYYIK